MGRLTPTGGVRSRLLKCGSFLPAGGGWGGVSVPWLFLTFTLSQSWVVDMFSEVSKSFRGGFQGSVEFSVKEGQCSL